MDAVAGRELVDVGAELHVHLALDDDQQLLGVAVRVRLVARRAAGLEAGDDHLERVERLRRQQRLPAEVAPRDELARLAPQHPRPLGASLVKRSETSIPSAVESRCSVAIVAFVRPRSSWLRKLSLIPAAVATLFSVLRRSCRIARSRSPSADWTSRHFSHLQCELNRMKQGNATAMQQVSQADAPGRRYSEPMLRFSALAVRLRLRRQPCCAAGASRGRKPSILTGTSR